MFAEQLIKQLAATQGININGSDNHKLPIENIPLWVANLKVQGKAERTIDLYEYSAKVVLNKVSEPTAIDLQQYFAQRLDQISPSGVNSEQKAIKSLFKYLNQFGLYSHDPAKDIILIHGADKQIEFPSDTQMNAIFSYQPIPKFRAKYRTMLILLVGTGLRITEACTLRRDLVNFNTHEITVLGKGNKERTIPIFDVAEKLLYQYINEDCPSDSPYVFSSPDSEKGHWDASGFWHMLRTACRQAGAKSVHPHQLRHYFATKTLEQGAKLEVISKILGHSNVAITAKVYRHIQQKEYHEELRTHSPYIDMLHEPLMLEEPKPEAIDGEFREVDDEEKSAD